MEKKKFLKEKTPLEIIPQKTFSHKLIWPIPSNWKLHFSLSNRNCFGCDCFLTFNTVIEHLFGINGPIWHEFGCLIDNMNLWRISKELVVTSKNLEKRRDKLIIYQWGWTLQNVSIQKTLGVSDWTKGWTSQRKLWSFHSEEKFSPFCSIKTWLSIRRLRKLNPTGEITTSLYLELLVMLEVKSLLAS